MPSIVSNGGGEGIDSTGAILYLSNKIVTNQFSRLYIFNLNDSSFKLVHNEDDYIVSQLKARGLSDNDFVYLNGEVRGPIRIWSINYPQGMTVNNEYLKTVTPSSLVL